MFRSYLRVINAEIVMNFKDTISYRVGLISDIIVMAVLYLCCIYIGGANSIGQYYGTEPGDSKSLVLLGYLFWSFSVLIIGSTSNSIRQDTMRGTLEQKVMSVAPLQIIFVGDLITELLINVIVVGAVCIISTLFLKISIVFNLGAIITLIITIVGMYGIALVFGGIALVSKRISNLVYIFQLILLIVSNAVIQVPISHKFGDIFPLTMGIHIARNFMLNRQVYMTEMLIFCSLCILWLVAGIIIFQRLLHKTKTTGGLSQY